MFLFGDGSFDSLTWISIPFDVIASLPLGDITEQISDTIQPCKVYGSIQITKVASQGTISLMSCSIENKDVLTVSGDLSKSAQINLTLLNPDMKKIQDVTFVKKEFSHTIGKELYSKDDGQWRINVIIDGPNTVKLSINVFHSLANAPATIIINNKVEILLAIGVNE